MRWPVIEVPVIAHLNATLAPVRAGTNLPGKVETAYPAGWVRVRRGPGSDDGITDSPLVDVEAFHTSQLDAADIAEDARQAMHALSGTAVDGVLIDLVETTSTPAWIWYRDGLERYVASYRVHTRQQ